MKLPLSKKEESEILAAYEAALSAARKCGERFEALSSILYEKLAYIDDNSKKAIEDETSRIYSSTWNIKVNKRRVLNSKIEGREISPNFQKILDSLSSDG